MSADNAYDIYQVDAFASNVFEGNPAAVVPVKQWFSDAKMQEIATENNLSETAFVIQKDGGDSETSCEYDIRWFTPAGEVDLCGHASLGSAYVIFQFLRSKTIQKIQFNTQKNGSLYVTKQEDDNSIGLLTIDFPSDTPKPWIASDNANFDEQELNKANIKAALNGAEIVEILLGRDDILVILQNKDTVINLQPNFSRIAAILNTKYRGLSVSAASNDDSYDFYSRSFFPTLGVNEDPVCGSAHCLISVYWSNIKNKSTLKARQASLRGGNVYIKLNEDKSRVSLSGYCAMYMKGTIWI
jgi:PhzF family phenazine biosynthesis protein